MLEIDKINELTSTEMTIYQYILQNMDKVHFMRVRDLAEVAHVSNASITRFIRKCGYDSFAEFRFKLKEEQKVQEKSELNNLTNSIYEFLDNTENPSFQQKFDYFVELIMEGRTLVFIGIGSSAINAEYGARILSNVGVPAFSIKDPYYPFDSLMATESNLAFVIMSVTGEVSIINDIVTKIRKNGQSLILSITGSDSNSLSKLSNMSISYGFEKEVTGDNYIVTSSVPAIFILEMVARRVYKSKQEKN